MSTDMVGFTELSHDIGQEQIYDLLSHTLGLASEIIEAHGGHVVDTAGDGLLAAFGAPQALENACLQCCRAADAFRARIHADANDLEARFGIVPAFRTGIGGGNTLVARLETGDIKVVGLPVNKAARLQAMAGANEIILSETIRREAEELLQTTDRGMVEIRGFPEPVRIYALDGLVETATRFDGPRKRGLIDFVSREAELATAFEACRIGQPARMVVISGVAGIGKSRLAHELQRRLAATRPVYVGQCTANELSRAFGPIIDILRQAGGATATATTRQVMDALLGRFPSLCDPAKVERFLSPVDPDRRQSDRVLRDREFLAGLLRALADTETCVFAIEDTHWIDAATNSLLASMAQAPVAMILTCRPEFDAEWLKAETVLRVDLAPLSDPDIRRIAEASFGTPVSEPLADLISQKSEGIPLIAEELTRALRFDDRVREGAAGLELTEGDGSLLTGNLEQLVLTRVDRLPPRQKAALQCASAIGRYFSEDLLNSALGRSANVDAIAEQPGLIEPTTPGQWRFAHALIRDAVYGSLLGSQRRTTHQAIAEAIEQSPGEIAEDWALLAEHFVKAEIPAKAVPVMVRAAMQDLNIYALDQVDRTLTQAAAYLDSDPDLIDDDGFRNLAVTWLRAMDHMGNFGRLQRVSARVLPRLEMQGYTAELSIARTMTSIAMTHLRDYKGAEALSLATLKDAEGQGDDWGAAWAKVALMRIYDETNWQPPDVVERLAAEIAPVAEATDDRHMGMTALYLLSSVYRSSGRRRKAIAIADEITKFADTHDDRRARAYAAWARALIFTIEGNPEKALASISPVRREVIPGSADDTVSRGIEIFAQTFLLPANEIRPRLLDMIDDAKPLDDFNVLHSLKWTQAGLELKAGNLAYGWRLINTLIPEVEAAGHTPITRQSYMMRGEFLLALAGLTDPISEAPPERPKYPRAKPGFADIVLYFYLRLTAKTRAARDFENALKTDQLKRGVNFARATIGLGLIAKARGRSTEAKTHLESGLKSAEEEGLDLLSGRARRALADLK